MGRDKRGNEDRRRERRLMIGGERGDQQTMAIRKNTISSSTSSSSLSPDNGADATAVEANADRLVTAPSLSHGSASFVGRREKMEDTITVSSLSVSDVRYEFFAVYDGHGGSAVSEACRDCLHLVANQEIVRSPPAGEPDGEWWKEVFAKTFAKVDEEVAEVSEALCQRKGTLGSTAVVAVIGPRSILVANCGDSRAVLCRHGEAIPLSTDHKPSRPDEKERIEAAGGYIIHWYGCRVLGVLATSRSIGDYHLKPFVSAEPDITITDQTVGDEFVILATDGLWDVVSNEEACKLARKYLFGRRSNKCQKDVNECRATLAAVGLVRLAIRSGSEDNVSVVVIQLKNRRGQTRV